jgi:hypothetical protein
MSATPEEELFVLMECAESPFGLGAPADYRWHVDRPGESPTIDLVRHLENKGCITVSEGRDPQGGRMQVHAEITPTGRKRMDELVRDGIQPSPGW